MSRENLVLCWCWCGAVVLWLLVLWCWLLWCYGVVVAGRLGFLVDQFHTHRTVLYHPLVSVGLTPLDMHLMTSCFLAWWLGRPDWFLGDICVCVSHVDKINILMIINSASFKFDCHLYYHGGFSLCILLCMQVIRRMKKKDLKIKIV
jgi:hypothetical protein